MMMCDKVSSVFPMSDNVLFLSLLSQWLTIGCGVGDRETMVLELLKKSRPDVKSVSHEIKFF